MTINDKARSLAGGSGLRTENDNPRVRATGVNATLCRLPASDRRLTLPRITDADGPHAVRLRARLACGGGTVTPGDFLNRVADRTGTFPRGSGRQKSARCPAHDDRRASLSIRLNPDKVLLKCHAGCSLEDILAALELTPADLFAEPRELGLSGGHEDWTPCGHGKAAEYLYRDEHGQVLYGVVRCPRKCFAQWRPDPTAKSGRRWRLRDDEGNLLVRLVPYRLPELIAAVAAEQVVWIAEGEKDVHALIARPGIAATCNSGGAGKWLPEFAQYFHGADVTIVADRDEAGERHALQVVETLRGVARSIVVVQARYGKDAHDHLAAGGHTGNFVTIWEPVPYPVHA